MSDPPQSCHTGIPNITKIGESIVVMRRECTGPLVLSQSEIISITVPEDLNRVNKEEDVIEITPCEEKNEKKEDSSKNSESPINRLSPQSANEINTDIDSYLRKNASKRKILDLFENTTDITEQNDDIKCKLSISRYNYVYPTELTNIEKIYKLKFDESKSDKLSEHGLPVLNSSDMRTIISPRTYNLDYWPEERKYCLLYSSRRNRRPDKSSRQLSFPSEVIPNATTNQTINRLVQDTVKIGKQQSYNLQNTNYQRTNNENRSNPLENVEIVEEKVKPNVATDSLSPMKNLSPISSPRNSSPSIEETEDQNPLQKQNTRTHSSVQSEYKTLKFNNLLNRPYVAYEEIVQFRDTNSYEYKHFGNYKERNEITLEKCKEVIEKQFKLGRCFNLRRSDKSLGLVYSNPAILLRLRNPKNFAEKPVDWKVTPHLHNCEKYAFTPMRGSKREVIKPNHIILRQVFSFHDMMKKRIIESASLFFNRMRKSKDFARYGLVSYSSFNRLAHSIWKAHSYSRASKHKSASEDSLNIKELENFKKKFYYILFININMMTYFEFTYYCEILNIAKNPKYIPSLSFDTLQSLLK